LSAGQRKRKASKELQPAGHSKKKKHQASFTDAKTLPDVTNVVTTRAPAQGAKGKESDEPAFPSPDKKLKFGDGNGSTPQGATNERLLPDILNGGSLPSLLASTPETVPPTPPPTKELLPPQGLKIVHPPKARDGDGVRPPHPPTSHALTLATPQNANVAPRCAPTTDTTDTRTLPITQTVTKQTLPPITNVRATPLPTFRDVVTHGLMNLLLEFTRDCGFSTLPVDSPSRQWIVSTFLKEHPLSQGSTEALPATPSYTLAAILHLNLQESFEQWLQTNCGIDTAIGGYVTKCDYATAFLLEEEERSQGMLARIEDDRFKARR
jgi:hypothetical protein